MWEHILTTELQLISAATGLTYTIQARCPFCYREYSLVETLDSFSADPQIKGNKCSGCLRRFIPILLVDNKAFPLIGPKQVLQEIKDGFYNDILLLEENQKLYHSAVVQFGSVFEALEAANHRLNLERQHPQWRVIASPYLGKLSDLRMARILGVSAKMVGDFRRKQGIKPFSRTDHQFYCR